MAKRKTNKQFSIEVYELVKDEYIFLDKYINTNTPILVRHNKCNHEWKIRPRDFLRGTRCPVCGLKERTRAKTKTHEQFIMELEKVHPKKYAVMEKYKTTHHPIEVQCNDCGYISKRRPSGMLRAGCGGCSGTRPITQEEFEEDIRRLWDGQYTIIGKYINADTPIETYCNNCDKSWFPIAYNLKSNYGCPNCAGNIRKTTEEFKEEIYNIVGDEYIVLGDYVQNKKDILIKHSICGYEWNITPSSFLSGGSRCPQCASSKGEGLIAKWLDNNNVQYMREYTYEDCRNKRPLPFDFYLPEYNLLIEYDGEQHFMHKTFGGISEEKAKLNFKNQQKRDSIKNKYCKENNIELLRIPYWSFDDIEKIVCNKINMLIPSQAS